jgi:hypothetical protein
MTIYMKFALNIEMHCIEYMEKLLFKTSLFDSHRIEVFFNPLRFTFQK